MASSKPATVTRSVEPRGLPAPARAPPRLATRGRPVLGLMGVVAIQLFMAKKLGNFLNLFRCALWWGGVERYVP